VAGEGLLATATLKPGYEADYYGSPEIYPVGCLGRLRSYDQLENGNYDIVLEGLVRVGFGPLIQDHPFRVAQLVELPERDHAEQFQSEREDLLLRLNYLIEHAPPDLDFTPVLHSAESFVALINLVARTLPLKNADQYKLLALDTIRERSQQILHIIDDQIETMELLKRVDPGSADLSGLN